MANRSFWLALGICSIVACGGGGGGGGSVDAPGSGSGSGTALTVKNFDTWCTVTVGSGAGSSAAAQTVTVQPGAIHLSATANTGFELSSTMWHHTDGDTTGSGEAGTTAGSASTTTVTVGATAKCVWVCCPFTNGTGCDIADQCP